MFPLMAARALPLSAAQIPNALTVVRLLLIPVFVAVLVPAERGHSVAAGVIFGAAGITDRLDGWLARRWRVESRFGKVADPLADRLMIDTAIVLLVVHERLPLVAVALILGRDAALLLGYKVLVTDGYELNVNLLGKVATFALYASVAFLLLTEAGTDWPLWLFWFGAALALAAAAQYAVTAVRDRG